MVVNESILKDMIIKQTNFDEKILDILVSLDKRISKLERKK